MEEHPQTPKIRKNRERDTLWGILYSEIEWNFRFGCPRPSLAPIGWNLAWRSEYRSHILPHWCNVWRLLGDKSQNCPVSNLYTGVGSARIPPVNINAFGQDVGLLYIVAYSIWHMMFMAALCNRAGHYIFAPWFLSSSLFYLFSSPNLSRRRLDVCHTSAHDVLRHVSTIGKQELIRRWDSERELFATFLSLKVYVYLQALLHIAPRNLPNSVK